MWTSKTSKTGHSLYIYIFSNLPISVQDNNLDDEKLDDMIHSVEPAKGFWSHLGLHVFWACVGLHTDMCLSPCRTPEGG